MRTQDPVNILVRIVETDIAGDWGYLIIGFYFHKAHI